MNVKAKIDSQLKDTMKKDHQDGAGMELFPTTTSSFFAVGGDGTRTEAQWRRFDAKYRKVLVRYATQVLKMDADLATDAVQELTIGLWKAPRLIYRPPNGKFRYVLVSVLRRKLGNLIKKDRRYRGRLELEKLTWIDETYYDFDTAARRAVKDYLTEDLCRRILENAVADEELKCRDAEMWQLSEVDDLDHRTIARRYGVNHTTVTRAVAKVESYLEGECDAVLADLVKI